MPQQGKEKTKEAKGKAKATAADLLRELVKHPHINEDVANSVKSVDFESEFNEIIVTKSILTSVEPVLVKEVERCSQYVDAFDKLIAGTSVENNSNEAAANYDCLEFCFTALKSIANMDLKFEGLEDLLQIKFKEHLIKAVLCDKLPDNMRNEASLICECIMEKNKYMEESADSGPRWISVYLWVVKCALRDGATRSEIKRVWVMRKLLTRYSVPENSPVIEALAATVISPNFLTHKEGRQHVAHLLSLDKSLVVRLNSKIKSALPSIFEKSKLLACCYGEIYNMAWTNALPEVRLELEDEVFQRWMEVYIKLDRPKTLVQSQFGKVIFRILSYLHNSRRLLELSSAITRLYQPILWRALTSHHPLMRCNAAELFLDVFPMEKPEANIVENSNFKEKQFKQIMDLLNDECHFTRIVAIRGVVLVMKRRMECLSNNQCREILSWLANELANDGSSYLVRVAVWEFFTSLAASEDPPEFLTSLLPQMTNYFHDLSEQVRKAFTTMLLEINRNKNLSISCTDVVPMSHIVTRLALEGETVGKLLVKLIMKSIYVEGMEILQFIKHLKRLIYMCPKAAENLFRWSPQVLTTANAQFIIMGILIYLRSFTKERVEGRADGSGKSTFKSPTPDSISSKKDGNSDKENVQSTANTLSDTTSPSASPVKKKRRKSKEKKRSSVIQADSPAKKDEGQIDVDGPTAEMHAHLLGCAHVTWIVFSKQFESQPTLLAELYSVVTVCLQNYLRCYKGTPAWYSSLALASLVPVTKLSENTTASSTCLGELRRTELSTPQSHLEALVYTLTAWNRGNEIIELAIDYIDPAFKLFHLNSSAFITAKRGGRGRTVRFAKPGGREIIGVRLLTVLLDDYHNEQRLLLKHYDHLHELYSYLESIKVILEARLDGILDEESASVLTDQFILDCFGLLLKLIYLLDRAEPTAGSLAPSFISTQNMINILDWATRILIPRVDELPVIDNTEEPDVEEEDEEEPIDDNDEENNGKKQKKKKSKKQSKPKKKIVKEDLVVTCLKKIVQKFTFMINIELTDQLHAAASAKLALTLLQSEAKYWFLEGCFDLVESLTEFTRAWHPDDKFQLLSAVCPSLYSHMLQSLTSNTLLSQHLLYRHNCDVANLKRKLMLLPSTLLTMYGASHSNVTKIMHSIVESCIDAVHSQALKINEIAISVRMEDLPFGIAMVTTSLLHRPKLMALFLPAVVDFIKKNTQEGVMVVCGLSYLYTIIENYKSKFVQVQMEQTVHTLYPLISELASTNCQQPQKDNTGEETAESEDSFFADPLANLDVKKLGGEILRKIADTVPCTLFRPNSPVWSRRNTALPDQLCTEVKSK